MPIGISVGRIYQASRPLRIGVKAVVARMRIIAVPTASNPAHSGQAQKRDGFSRFNAVFEFDYPYNGRPATWCDPHLARHMACCVVGPPRGVLPIASHVCRGS
jgi:hypothetical protein